MSAPQIQLPPLENDRPRAAANPETLVADSANAVADSGNAVAHPDAVPAGHSETGDALFLQVYGELRRLAAARMSREAPGHTLQPTALVHEAWLRLGGAAGEAGPRFENRAHIIGAAAEAMRRILIERARRKLAARRGAGAEHVATDEVEIAAPAAAAAEDELLTVHEALDALAAHDPRKAELVKLRYFVGLTNEEAAAALGISVPTAKRDWTYARAWLFREIQRTHH